MRNQKGFTFIEVMVALVILSVGIVGIFKSLLIALDQMDYLTHRLYASTVLQNTLVLKERRLRNYQELSLGLGDKHAVDIGPHTVTYQQKIRISEIESYPDLFEIAASLSWDEGDKRVTVRNAGYLLDSTYKYDQTNP
jgi:prepilin-type N-terminal cleavage/methylation domain-containing protein